MAKNKKHVMKTEGKKRQLCLSANSPLNINAIGHFGSLQGVLHQHGDGHGANTTRYRCDGRCNLGALLKRYIPLQLPLPRSGFAHLIDTNIDDNSTRLHHVSLDILRHPRSNNQHVRPLGVESDVLSSSVTDSHRGIPSCTFLHQHGSDGLPYDVGPAYNHNLSTFERCARANQQLLNPIRSAGQEIGVSNEQLADIGGVETIHILLWQNGQQDLLLIDVFGQRQLHKNAVNLGHIVVLVHKSQQICFRDIVRLAVLNREVAKFFGGFAFGADITL
mmetsp:Transcript_37901/g.62465  ORF Transcript_37901/g.62465 Transcript_37901/m.62465 type:complete len:276 (-) Transcript_37901:292-1119(-)